MRRMLRQRLNQSFPNRNGKKTRHLNLRLETLEARTLLAGDPRILFLGMDPSPTAGADGAVMEFLETNYGADNVDYKQSTVANNTTDIANVDLLILSSTASSGDYRGKYHNAAVPILNWEEAVMDNGAGEFGLSSDTMSKSTTTTQITIVGNHPITAGLTGTIDFVSVGSETLSTSALYAGLTSVAEAANGTKTSGGGPGGSVAGNPMIFVAEAGQDVDPASGASPATGRRVMFPIADSTFSSLTPDGLQLFANSINWLADLNISAPTVVNRPATDVSALSATLTGEVIDGGGESPNVTIFYGENDGGTAAANWDQSIDVGTQTGTFSTFVTGLGANTNYFFTSRAENSAGVAWAPLTATFSTLPLSLPGISNAAPENVTSTAATIGGEVTATGNDVPNVTLYWGDNDGGVTAGNWDHAINLGPQDGPFVWELGGLSAQTAYYYRAFAQNGAGPVWASSSESFVTLPTSLDDVYMYNDHRAGGRTHVNVTSYAGNATNSGLLKNFETGLDTDITLTVTGVGVNYGLWSQFPTEGTDADEIFGDIIDFTLGPGAELELQATANDSYTHAFSGLDPQSDYDFAGTAIRGDARYTNRWTLVTLNGAESFTPAHSEGVGMVTDGLADNQVALWSGVNDDPDQGFVARWTDITAGADGAFEVVQQQYTGPIPTTVHAGGVANGASGYGFSAVRLVKTFSALAVLQSDPFVGEKFTTAPTSATIDFSAPVDASTVDAGDLTVDGTPATSFTIVDSDTIRWQLPAGLGPGQHTVELAEGVLAKADGRTFIGYSSPFFVVTPPAITNTPATKIAATTADFGAEVTANGLDDPTVQIYWGDNDGGTNPANWDAAVNLGTRGIGQHDASISGLTQGAQYYFRALATNLAGSSWAPSTSTFTTATPTLPVLTNAPATNVGAFSAELSGSVNDIGNDPPTITIYYGETDGGTVAAAWQNSIDVGVQTGAFNTFVAGLEPETTYFYRAAGENLAGTSWAAASLSFTTANLPPLTISEVVPANLDSLLTRIRLDATAPFEGAFLSPDWIEIHNPTPVDVDLVSFHLTDDRNDPFKWTFPSASVVPANGYLVVFASGENLRDTIFDETGRLHTNFVLDGGGEYLALTGGDGDVIFAYAPEFPGTPEGYSYGLDSQDNATYFKSPTPGLANDDTSAFPGFVADTRFSADRGFYEAPFSVDITTDTLGASIVYTTDGSVPSLANGTKVDAAGVDMVPVATVNIATTSVLRARAYRAGLEPTNIDTQSYIFVEDVLDQPAQPSGFPASWGSAPGVDYEMDPEVVDDPTYTADLLAGLRAIPTLSIVSPISDVFGPSGIYSIPTNTNLEVAASAELILPDGSSGFQIDAGFKVQGGASRNPDRSAKHSLSLRFRNEYGDGQLNYPLFKGSPVESYDSIHLRAMYNNSWIHWDDAQRPRGTLIRDQWMRDSLLAMGQEDAGAGTYMHLYIDGLYWGVYNVHERAEAAHYAAYNGGDEDDYDALNGGSPIDGDLTSYNAMKDTVATQDWDAIQQVLDVDNYIDWTIMQRFGSNNDLKADGNWRAAGGGPNNAPWHFYSWDAERILEGVNEGAPGGTADPPGILSTLNQIDEFRLRFADRIQLHFFNDGALTPENTAARWTARTNELENAIVAESARWGDYRRDVHQSECPCDLYRRDEHWVPESNRLTSSYFPARTNIVLGQYRSLGLYPSVDAAALMIDGVAQHGGEISAGATLSFTGPGGGTVYYTLDGSDPRAEGGDAVGIPFVPGADAPVSLGQSVTVNARVLSGNTWSALTSANFLVVPAAGAIVVSEINYNPYERTDAEVAAIPNVNRGDFEFIELLNKHATATVNLLDMRFTSGIDFTFPDVSLAPGERAVIVSELNAFAVRYGDSVAVAGQWSGSLANGGETLTLVDGVGNVVLEFEYSDNAPWPTRADGAGATLVLADEAGVPATQLGKHYSWRGSSEFGGSPGSASSGPVGIVISEVLANSETVGGGGDSIEIHNPGSEAEDISGWLLSDSARNLLKFEIPAGTVVSAGGYVVFDENDFNPTPLNPGAKDFALSGSDGDDAWLVIPDGMGGVATFVDDLHFGATADGESVGRVTDGTVAPLARRTLGCVNSHPRVGPLVMSEVQFNPGEPSPAALNVYAGLVEDDLEFVEIYNPADSPVNLTEWHVRSGVDYDFAENTMIGGGAAIVVISFNPENTDNASRLSAFRTHYGIGNDVMIVGGFAGQLSDSGEAVRLRRPGTPDPSDPLLIPRLLEDEVIYDDLAPWPIAADGQGDSLQRALSTAWGNAAASWRAASPSPGSVRFAGIAAGDVNADGVVNAVDINMTYDAANASSSISVFDLDGNGVVNQADGAYLVGTILGTLPGDANLDGVVDGSDFNRWNDHKFQDCSTGWSAGDFNGDTTTDASDFNMWLANRFQPVAAAAHNAGVRPVRAALAVNNAAVVTLVQEMDAERATTEALPSNLRLSIRGGFDEVSFVDADILSVRGRGRHLPRALRRFSSSEMRGGDDENADPQETFESLSDAVFAKL